MKRPACRATIGEMKNATHGVEHYENFPVASFLCPPALRPAVSAIYWYARTADDIADEGNAPPQTRLDDLAAYRADLEACAARLPTSQRWAGVFKPLQSIIQQHTLPLHLLTDLLSAFEQDVTKTRYASQSELLDYCRRSANPVGRLLLHLYGVRDAVSLQQSDEICTALQLINFWQDLSVDLARDRIYSPADYRVSLGISDSELLARTFNFQTSLLIAADVAWAKTLMKRGAPLAKRVPGRAGWELRLVVQGGLRIAEKIERLGFNTLKSRTKITVWDIPALSWRAMCM